MASKVSPMFMANKVSTILKIVEPQAEGSKSNGVSSLKPLIRRNNWFSNEDCQHIGCFLLNIPHMHTLEKIYDLKNKVIGAGSSGIVHMCINRQTKEQLACKLLPKRFMDLMGIQSLQNEVKILQLLKNYTEIITLHDVCEDENNVYLIMEYCSGGDMFHRIFNNRHSPVEEMEAANVMRQIVQMLHVCRMNGVIHRDLKPENIVYATQGKDSLIKLIDMGSATMSTHCKDGRYTDMVGTFAYAAPEMLKGQYGIEVDMWSAGVIAYCLLCNRLPFSRPRNEEKGEIDRFKKRVLCKPVQLRDEVWLDISDEAKSFVFALLEHDPKARLTPHEALNHKWLSIDNLNKMRDIKSCKCKKDGKSKYSFDIFHMCF